MIQNNTSDSLLPPQPPAPPPSDSREASSSSDSHDEPEFWNDRHIEVQIAANAPPTTRLFKRPYVLIGSHPESDIVLNSSRVSRRHLCLLAIHGGLYCLDLAETLQRQQQSGYWLDADSPITVGRWQLRGRLRSPQGAPFLHQRHNIDYTDQPLAGTYPVVIALHAGREVGRYRVRKPITTIGQSPANKVTLSSDFLSTFHCVLIREADQLWIVDLLAANPTMINGTAIKAAKVGFSGRVALGDVILKFRRPLPKTNAVDQLIPNNVEGPSTSASSSDILTQASDSALDSKIFQAGSDPNDKPEKAVATPTEIADQQSGSLEELQRRLAESENRCQALEEQWERHQRTTQQQEEQIDYWRSELERIRSLHQQQESQSTATTDGLQQAQRQIAEKTAQLQLAEDARDQARASLQALEQAFQVSQTQLQGAQLRITEQNEQLAIAAARCDESQQRIDVVEQLLTSAREQQELLQREVAARDQRLASLTQDHERMTAEIRQQAELQQQSNRAAEEQEASAQTLASEVDQLRRQLADVVSTSGSDEQRRQELERVAHHWETQCRETERLCETLDRSIRELEQRLEDSRRECQQREAAVRERESQLQQLQITIVAERDQAIKQTEEQAGHYQNLLEECERARDSARAEAAQLSEELAAVRDELPRLQADLVQWQMTASSTQTAVAELQQQLIQRQSQLESVQQELATSQAGTRELEQQLQGRVQALEVMQREYSTLADQLKMAQGQIDVLVPAIELANQAREEYRESLAQANLFVHQQREQLQELQTRNEQQAEQILKLQLREPVETVEPTQLPDGDTQSHQPAESIRRTQWEADLERQERELIEARERLDRARIAFEREMGIERTQYQVIQNLHQLQQEKKWWYRWLHWFHK